MGGGGGAGGGQVEAVVTLPYLYFSKGATHPNEAGGNEVVTANLLPCITN